MKGDWLTNKDIVFYELTAHDLEFPFRILGKGGF